jgi:DNA-binding response OmpR family regulator
MQRFKILIAEDETVSRYLMEASLTNWGHEAVVADDGEQALNLLQAGGIHICILDWEMPKVSGIELCRWIRGAHLTPEPHVILLTGRKETEHIQAGYAAGANDYIIKPFNREDLRTRILSLTQTIF